MRQFHANVQYVLDSTKVGISTGWVMLNEKQMRRIRSIMLECVSLNCGASGIVANVRYGSIRAPPAAAGARWRRHTPGRAPATWGSRGAAQGRRSAQLLHCSLH